MSTTITIKTDKKLHRDAKKTARELGIPLTTVINAYLKDFVREKTFSVSARPVPKPEKVAEWGRMSDDMDKYPEKYPSYTIEELLTDLKTRWAKADRKAKVKSHA